MAAITDWREVNFTDVAWMLVAGIGALAAHFCQAQALERLEASVVMRVDSARSTSSSRRELSLRRSYRSMGIPRRIHHSVFQLPANNAETTQEHAINVTYSKLPPHRQKTSYRIRLIPHDTSRPDIAEPHFAHAISPFRHSNCRPATNVTGLGQLLDARSHPLLQQDPGHQEPEEFPLRRVDRRRLPRLHLGQHQAQE